MPSTSTAQRRATAIAEHHPDQLYARNRGLLGMNQRQLHEFASTKEKGLPHHVAQHPHRNLGGFLHKAKSSLKHRMRSMRTSGAFRASRGARSMR